MDYRTYVILFILSKFGSERSVSGIYHLLTGKKSSQTIQDGRFFNILFLFNTMNNLTREAIDDSIRYLIQYRYIEKVTDEHFIVSQKGEHALREHEEYSSFFEYLNGWKYHEMASVFWKRYSFMVQCLSNLIQGHNSFLPITRISDIQLWTKRNIPRSIELRRSFATAIFDETQSFLSQLDPLDASYFVLRLSGKNKVGYTHEQCALFLGLEESLARMRFVAVLHRLMNEIENEKYSTLQIFVRDIESEFPLTSSTKRTYDLLMQGRSLEEISRIRKLKLNTIEDHIVELAINIPNYNIDNFVDALKQQKITETILQLNTKRLKQIKDQINEDISYFQIRLVMARLK